jgi:porphobilinogen deaminase
LTIAETADMNIERKAILGTSAIRRTSKSQTARPNGITTVISYRMAE